MPPAVVIVLPVFRPDKGHFAQQINSIARQTLADTLTVLVIADTESADLAHDLASAAGLSHVIETPPNPLDAPRAVEAGLFAARALAGPDTLFALCDQDDMWHPDRLARGQAALAASGAALAHGDARLVDAEGALLHPSMFRYEGRQRRPGLRGLLLRNNVTGMTVLMRRSLVELALPFPQQAGVHFYHDLWLALLAEATQGVVLVPGGPLVDYRQHGTNVMGAIDRRRLRFSIGRPDASWLRREAAGYGLARYLAHSLKNRLEEAIDAGLLPKSANRLRPIRAYLGPMTGGVRHLGDMLRLGATGHLRLSRIALGHGVTSAGRAVWSLRKAMGPGLEAWVHQFDERLYSLSPGMPPAPPRSLITDKSPAKPASAILDMRKTPRFTPVFEAEGPAINILVPTLNPTEIFAGIQTALDIGVGLAARGLSVRFIATDLPISSHETSRGYILNRLDTAQAAKGAAGRVTLACGVIQPEMAMHRQDRFLATAWWSAHLADTLIRQHGFAQPRFHYLIQDFEPNFYAWGPENADAAASYALNFAPVFNTVPLRDYFALMGYRFAGPDALVFHPAVDVERYASGARMQQAGPRRIALYGRPEVPRNMFPTAIEALDRFLAAAALAPAEVEILSVGLRHEPVELAGGHVVQSLGKLPLASYPDWLLGMDIGLSLMLSPHPSHPPLEMAASGMRVVTNLFAGKDLSRLTPAILSVEPAAIAVAEGLARAWAMPPVPEGDRHFDLCALGAPLSSVIATLATDLAPAD